MVSYSTDKRLAANVKTITAQRALEIIQMNHRGEKPVSLEEETENTLPQQPVDLVEQNSLTRFDRSKRRKKNNKHNGRKGQNGENKTAQTEAAAAPAGEQRAERNNRRNGNRSNNGNRPRREQKSDETGKGNGKQATGANQAEAKQQ